MRSYGVRRFRIAINSGALLASLLVIGSSESAIAQNAAKSRDVPAGAGCEWLNGETIPVNGAQHLVSAGGLYDLREWGDDQWQIARDAIRAVNEKDRKARGP